MTYVELLLWWQSRYPQWASVTAPLVRHFVESTVQSVPLKTILRLSFVRALWRDESVRMSNAPTRLCNVYDCSAITIIEDLQRVGIRPLAEFLQRYPTQSQLSNASISTFSATSQEIIQDVSDFDKRLTDFHQAHEVEIRQAIAITEATCPKLVLDDVELTPEAQDDMCFEWSHYLAIADGLEPERLKLVKFVKPDSEPSQIVAGKCAQFFAQIGELLQYSRKNNPPQVLRSWLDEVETWMQSSRLAFPNYESVDQARKSKKQKAQLRFEQLLDEPSRKCLASIGQFALAEDGKFGLKVTYKELKELAAGWVPMSLEVMIDRKAKKAGFTENDKSTVLKAVRRFTSEIPELQARAVAHARSLGVELLHKGEYVSANDLTDDQLLGTVRKLTIQAWHLRQGADEPVALLKLDCDWDIEHGVCFGLMSTDEIVLQP